MGLMGRLKWKVFYGKKNFFFNKRKFANKVAFLSLCPIFKKKEKRKNAMFDAPNNNLQIILN